MNDNIKEKIENVLQAPHMGGLATTYTVHHTAERVMLVFGLFPGQHREAMKQLIAKQTDGTWVESTELETITGAQFAIGLPECIDELKSRLRDAGVFC
ncbi:hypothetical protein Q9292_00755 [Methylophilus sp. VKM B-3414]|uniref:hypothetical protein n=1 Tax=Methylophilus sp. VKM B-3414 TaxID=3076121 RepID=UPI0028CA2A53|nr:hypothetical protein [Methylophilus sp. VKM B-3414]MDT7848120.1 hypothetical protein [Methylophilus sp. VKM B-3414]